MSNSSKDYQRDLRGDKIIRVNITDKIAKHVWVAMTDEEIRDQAKRDDGQTGN